MKPVLPLILFLTILTSPGMAEVTVRAYEQGKTDASVAESLRLYIAGVAEGFRVADVQCRRTRDSRPLFCLPKGYTFGSVDYATLVDSEIHRKRDAGERNLEDRYIEQLLFEALQRKYPCARH
jgi:hypothetical protein